MASVSNTLYWLFSSGNITDCSGTLSSYVFPSSICSSTTQCNLDAVSSNATVSANGINYPASGSVTCDGQSHPASLRASTGSSAAATGLGTYACAIGEASLAVAAPCNRAQSDAIVAEGRSCDLLFYRSENAARCLTMLGCDSSLTNCVSYIGDSYVCNNTLQSNNRGSYVCNCAAQVSNAPNSDGTFTFSGGNVPASAGCGLPAVAASVASSSSSSSDSSTSSTSTGSQSISSASASSSSALAPASSASALVLSTSLQAPSDSAEAASFLNTLSGQWQSSVQAFVATASVANPSASASAYALLSSDLARVSSSLYAELAAASSSTTPPSPPASQPHSSSNGLSTGAKAGIGAGAGAAAIVLIVAGLWFMRRRARDAQQAADVRYVLRREMYPDTTTERRRPSAGPLWQANSLSSSTNNNRRQGYGEYEDDEAPEYSESKIDPALLAGGVAGSSDNSPPRRPSARSASVYSNA